MISRSRSRARVGFSPGRWKGAMNTPNFILVDAVIDPTSLHIMPCAVATATLARALSSLSLSPDRDHREMILQMARKGKCAVLMQWASRLAGDQASVARHTWHTSCSKSAQGRVHNPRTDNTRRQSTSICVYLYGMRSRKEKYMANHTGVTRRRFLQGLGVATAGLPLVSSLEHGAQAASTPIIEGQVVRPLTLKVNGTAYRLEVEPHRTLADVIRKELGLTGTKVVCDRASCGACTVLLEGRTVFSCHLLAVQADGQALETIEGLADGDTLHPIQQAFLHYDAYQCG